MPQEINIALEAAKPAEQIEQAIVDVALGDVFTLHYRKNSQICFLNFHFPSTEGMTKRDHIAAGIERAKLHCEKMRYRFIFCVPFVEDLNTLERRMAI